MDPQAVALLLTGTWREHWYRISGRLQGAKFYRLC